MRWLACILILVWPVTAAAQSSQVQPTDLVLSVEVEEQEFTPLTREMILITIRGVYRRHITREKLVQPDFEGFSWSQLGRDKWYEERVRGQKVKVFERRMAIYPNRPGTLTIGAFTHKLTLTDEGDDWFDHQIQSDPVTISVAPAPEVDGWWFPTKSLQVSDQWSNAPELLKPGEGVLRMIRIEALGVTPEMIPPMPELHSPSAMIFAHPEKRLVELTPEGPVTYAFWRWTIQPTNAVSTIVEPLTFSYFDTRNRELKGVTITAQRVAYDARSTAEAAGPAAPTRLPGWPVGLLAVAVFALGVMAVMFRRRLVGKAALQRFGLFDPLARGLRREARARNAAGVRRNAAALMARDGSTPDRVQLLHRFDANVFAKERGPVDLIAFARSFLASRKSPVNPD